MEDAGNRNARRRRTLVVLAALPLMATGVARAAAVPGQKRLGILLPQANIEEAKAVFAEMDAKRLARHGWIEGRSLEIIWRWSNDESRFAAMARQIVDARPDVIGTEGTACTRALQQATRAIPIFTTVGDPVGSGFARSLARPGGNITGLSLGLREIARKQVELLRALVPQLTTLVIIGAHKSLDYLREIAGPIALASAEAGISAQARQVSSLKDIEAALRALPPAGRGAVAFMGNLADIDVGSVMQLAIRLRIPSMVGERDRVEGGGLLSYTLYHEDDTQRTADLVDKLLRGADPAGIPFELPAKSRFVFNRRTALAIGLKIPADFLLRADEIIG